MQSLNVVSGNSEMSMWLSLSLAGRKSQVAHNLQHSGADSDKSLLLENRLRNGYDQFT